MHVFIFQLRDHGKSTCFSSVLLVKGCQVTPRNEIAIALIRKNMVMGVI